MHEEHFRCWSFSWISAELPLDMATDIEKQFLRFEAFLPEVIRKYGQAKLWGQ